MNKDEFIKTYLPMAQRATAGTNVDPIIMLSQAMQEGGFNPNRPGNSFFNITGPGMTRGDTNARGEKIQQSFRTYDTPQDSFNDYAKLIGTSPRYAGMLQGSRADRIAALGKSGYAEDPNYASRVASLASGISGESSGGGGGMPPPSGMLGAQSPVVRAALEQYLAKGKSLTGVQANLQDRLGVLIGAMPEDMRKGFQLTSTYRSPEQQQVLWDAALKKYGSPEAARKWVAPPGKSNHGQGTAMDLGYGSPEAKAWMHANAEKYGLKFPLGNEPWHIETAETRGGPAFQGTWGSAPGASTQPGQVAGVLAPTGAPAAPAVPAPPAAGFLEGLRSVTNPTETPDAPMETTPWMPAPAPNAPQTTEVQGAGDLMAGLLARRRGFA